MASRLVNLRASIGNRHGAKGGARITEGRVNHIFSGKPGKLADTPANRKLIINLSSNEKKLLGTDKFGTKWYAEIQKDGSQIYSSVNKAGEITGAGVHTIPRKFTTERGLRIKPQR